MVKHYSKNDRFRRLDKELQHEDILGTFTVTSPQRR
jgi:hypothetical protein